MYNSPVSLSQLNLGGLRDLSGEVLRTLDDEKMPQSPPSDTVTLNRDRKEVLKPEKTDSVSAAAPIDPQSLKKKELLLSLIEDHTGGADLDRLTAKLSSFTLDMIQKVKAHGVTVHILRDKPGEGDIKPTDLGFGRDLDKNGKIEAGKWVDLNGNGAEDPGEREDLTSGGYSWNTVNGAYDTATNILFYKEGEVSDASDYHDASILHEFSHAVDDAMRNDESSSDWGQQIDKNFNEADGKKTGHGFVDGYAAYDGAEYLAQSTAAYLTNRDIPDDPSNDESLYFAPDNITRAHLKKKDQAMYLFLDERFTGQGEHSVSPTA